LRPSIDLPAVPVPVPAVPDDDEEEEEEEEKEASDFSMYETARAHTPWEPSTASAISPNFTHDAPCDPPRRQLLSPLPCGPPTPPS